MTNQHVDNETVTAFYRVKQQTGAPKLSLYKIPLQPLTLGEFLCQFAWDLVLGKCRGALVDVSPCRNVCFIDDQNIQIV